MSAMDLSSGPMSSGRTADVYAAFDGRVVKLLKPGFDPFMLDVELAKTAAAHAAGIPAPRVGDRVDTAYRGKNR